jgi:hypothetical protein
MRKRRVPGLEMLFAIVALGSVVAEEEKSKPWEDPSAWNRVADKELMGMTDVELRKRFQPEIKRKAPFPQEKPRGFDFALNEIGRCGVGSRDWQEFLAGTFKDIRSEHKADTPLSPPLRSLQRRPQAPHAKCKLLAAL